ncbi:chorismate mutase [ANME-2 cluster archaeon]|nr:MAG: chorismate mutase [ANME-2 cluster archaeon]RLG24309.1 MAG: chorismate mutase [Methanosarcinales archaeon]
MELADIREKIEQIDKDILTLIAERTNLAETVLELKRAEEKSIEDKEQEQIVLNRAIDYATELNLDTGSIKQIFLILIEMNIERQRELSGEGNLP